MPDDRLKTKTEISDSRQTKKVSGGSRATRNKNGHVVVARNSNGNSIKNASTKVSPTFVSDDVFKKASKKVFKIHDRLLAKLAQ